MASNILMTTRGDSFDFGLEVEDYDSPQGRYRLTDEDALYLGIMLPHQKFEDALIKRKFTKEDQDSYGSFTASLSAAETAELRPGVYYYAVKLLRVFHYSNGSSDEKVTTIINKTKFIVND